MLVSTQFQLDRCHLLPLSSQHIDAPCVSPTSDLDEGEGWSGVERLHFVLHVVLDVLLQAPMLVDVLLLVHVEEDSGRHGDGNGILWLWLRTATRGGKSCVSLFAQHFL